MRILVNDFSGHPFQLQLSRALATRGHEIHHVYFAANNTPKGAVNRVQGDPETFSVEGLTIGCEFSKHSLLRRRRADVAYGRAVAARVATFRPQAVISSNMPTDGQRVLLAAARKQQARFVSWVQELYYTAIEFVLRKKHVPFAAMAAAYYKWLEKDLLRKSDAVVCIAAEFLDPLAQWGVAHDRIFVIENWAPLDEITRREKDNPWAREHGLADKFCFMYSGTLGMKHNPALLLALANEYAGCEDVSVVVIADGAGANWLRQQRRAMPRRGLQLLPFQPYDRLSEVLGAADVLISILDSNCGAFTAVPSKTLTYLCAGRPLLVAAPEHNLAAKIVSRAAAGIVVDPDDSAAFVAGARALRTDPRRRTEFARNARMYAENKFAIDHIRGQFMSVLARAGCQDATGRMTETSGR